MTPSNKSARFWPSPAFELANSLYLKQICIDHNRFDTGSTNPSSPANPPLYILLFQPTAGPWTVNRIFPRIISPHSSRCAISARASQIIEFQALTIYRRSSALVPSLAWHSGTLLSWLPGLSSVCISLAALTNRYSGQGVRDPLHRNAFCAADGQRNILHNILCCSNPAIHLFLRAWLRSVDNLRNQRSRNEA